MNKMIAVAVVALLVGFGSGFIAGGEYKAYQVRKAFSEVFSDTKQPSTVAEATLPSPTSAQEKNSFAAPSKDENVIEKNLGDDISLATMDLKIADAKEQSILQSKYGQPRTAKEGAKFIVVTMKVTNTTSGTFDFHQDGFNLLDAQNRSYLPGTDFGVLDNQLPYRSITPNVSETGLIWYEVPEDATSYSLTVRKAGGNDFYKITLK